MRLKNCIIRASATKMLTAVTRKNRMTCFLSEYCGVGRNHCRPRGSCGRLSPDVRSNRVMRFPLLSDVIRQQIALRTLRLAAIEPLPVNTLDARFPVGPIEDRSCYHLILIGRKSELPSSIDLFQVEIRGKTRSRSSGTGSPKLL